MNKPNQLYQLLPAIYRQRDAEQGYPLRALLTIIGREVDVIEADINQLYENWFIETCEDWVVPYIAELIGFRPVHEAGEPGDPRTAQSRARNKILTARREVGNTISSRRRKGTLALLELLANNVAVWPARASEFYKLLASTQHLKYPHLRRGRTVDLRRIDTLEQLDGPFDRLAHTLNVRRIISRRWRGRHQVTAEGLFVWRLRNYSVSWTKAQTNEWKSPVGCTPAYCREREEGPHCYSFSVLGNDLPLYNRPQREKKPTQIAGETNLPTPIRRRAFEKRVLVQGRLDHTEASEFYYGAGRSLAIWAPDWPEKGAEQPVPAQSIIPADLSQWHYHPRRNRVAVDPVTGRMIFPSGQLPKRGVLVYYQYAFSADLGGGEYERRLSEPENAQRYEVGKGTEFETITAAYQKWQSANPKPPAAVIEIVDSGVYTEPLAIELKAGESLQIRAANRMRPVLRILDYIADRPDAFCLSGGKGSRFALDGLLVTGRGLQVQGPEIDPEASVPVEATDICDVTIRHCTLVPGWGLRCDCEPHRPGEPSVELLNTSAHLKVEHSIVGPIRVEADEERTNPICVDISDSICDATDTDKIILGALDRDRLAFARLTMARSTVFGEIRTHEIGLAENCIFLGHICVARRQRGCMRFCYVTPDSRTPRRYECQPELAERTAAANLRADAAQRGAPRPSDAEIAAVRSRARTRVEPEFNSTRYGAPAYCQLSDSCAEEITRGADDESEMGAWHDLYQPQRAANLRARLDEHAPAGVDTGIIYAT